MSEKKANLAAVSTFADHEVIVPPNKLKKAVQKLKPGEKVALRPGGARGSRARGTRRGFLGLDGQRMRPPRCGAQRHQGLRHHSRATSDVLFRAAHDIKGEAATFGYPLVAPVADSLCRLIEHTPDLAQLPLRLVDQHVDAIRRSSTATRAATCGKYAAQLAEKLRHVTDEFLLHENRDDPERSSRSCRRRWCRTVRRSSSRKRDPAVWARMPLRGHERELRRATMPVSFAGTRLSISTSSSQNSRASSRAASVA